MDRRIPRTGPRAAAALGARTACWLVTALVAMAPPAVAGPSVRVVDRDLVHVRVRSLTATPLDPPAAGSFEVEVPDEGTEIPIALAWPDAGHVADVRLEVLPRPPRKSRHVLLLRATTALADGRRVEARRELVFGDSGTALFEVHRDDRGAIVLAIEAEHSRERVLSTRPEIGAPIRLHLEIQRVDGNHSLSLENNQMNTFVGEPVKYSFRLGEPGQAESLEIRLTPQKLYGDLARIEIEVSGLMPDGEKMSMISRKQQWLTSRGSTSSLSVELGQPPRGYRFLVTPEF